MLLPDNSTKHNNIKIEKYMNPPKNSTFAHLPQADRDQLLSWCDHASYTDTVTRAAQPRDQGGLGLHISRSALARFYARASQQARLLDLVTQCAKTLEHRQPAYETVLHAITTLLENATCRALYHHPDEDPARYLPMLRFILQSKKYRDKKTAGVDLQTFDQYYTSLDHQPAPDDIPLQDPADPNRSPDSVSSEPDPRANTLLHRALNNLDNIVPFDPATPTAALTSQPAEPPQLTENPHNPANSASPNTAPSAVPPPIATAPSNPRKDFIRKPTQPQKRPFYLGALKRR